MSSFINLAEDLKVGSKYLLHKKETGSIYRQVQGTFKLVKVQDSIYSFISTTAPKWDKINNVDILEEEYSKKWLASLSLK